MKTSKKSMKWKVSVALLGAIIVVLSATPLGLIPIPFFPINATTVHIPVIIGAIILGPLAGSILGGIFGICSMVKATLVPTVTAFIFSPAVAASQFGPTCAVKAFWVAFVCRILIGFVTGWLWILLKKTKCKQTIAFALIGLCGALTNTILVMGSIFFLFPSEYAKLNELAASALFKFVLGIVVANGIPEAIVAAILVSAITTPLIRITRNQF